MGLNIFSKNKALANHYKAPVECSNCGNVGMSVIIKGITKEIAVKEDKCNICGCSTLKLLTEAEYNKKIPIVAPSSGLFS